MKIYLIPYLRTSIENLVKVCSLDPEFYENEIIGPHPIEYGSIYVEEVIDAICEIQNMAYSAVPKIENMLSDFELENVNFEFTPDQIECGLFVPHEIIKDIPTDLLENDHDLIFPNSKFLNKINGLFEIIH